MRRGLVIALALLCLIMVAVSNTQTAIAHRDAPAHSAAEQVTPEPGGPRLAAFKVGAVDTSATLAPYKVTANADNVVVSSPLSAQQLDYLTRNAFVVSPGQELEFYTVYENARYNYEPLFITTDSLLHSFHLAFDKVLQTSETKYFMPLLQKMNAAMLKQADAEYTALKGTDWEQAAQRTVAYIGVAAMLADPKVKVPAYAQDMVNKELALINAASGIQPSVIFPELNNGEDYSQYTPRGHYTRSDLLKSYFKSMMWYGRMTFRLSKPEETKSALVLVRAIRSAQVGGKSGLEAWTDLYAPTTFFAGFSDALTIPQYSTVMDQVYGANATIKVIQGKGIDSFVAAAQALPGPKILTQVINDTDNVDKETKGLRFMGQRFVLDAYIFRQLVYRNVGTQEHPRALPMALDVWAALGSTRAKAILDDAGASSFEKYNDQLGKVQGEMAKLQEGDLTSTLYNSWLYTMNTLNQPVGQGYPSFMTNQAYTDRSLYAALGSFAELKHDTILYAEQSYAEMGGGGGKEPPPEPVAPPNYVEPVPMFWARLGALAEMSNEGLGKLNLLDPLDAETLNTIGTLARQFQKDSEMELKNQPLSDDEQHNLRFYGGQLESIYRASMVSPESSDGPGAGFNTEPQAAVVADVATDPQSQQVLELGVGRVFNMFAAVPDVNGKLWMAHGAVFSFYEFPQPLNNRLTDEAWQQMLKSGKAPEVPAWTSSFMSKETVDTDLIRIVRQFQTQMVDTLWGDPASSANDLNSQNDPVSKYLLTQLDPLVKANQYEGRQIIETSFRSFDMQDANTAIVTTREIWRGELHANGADAYTNGPKIAERGPYTVDVTYTLSKGENGWTVTNIVVNGALPAWTNTK